MTALSSIPLAWREPIEIFAGLEDRPFSLFLDSADISHPDARWSFIAVDPRETILAKGNVVTVTDRDGRHKTFSGNPFSILRDRLAAMSPGHGPAGAPFTGGAAGFFGYELGGVLERLPQPIGGSFPDLAVGLYDNVIAFDHRTRTATRYCHTADKPFTTVQPSLPVAAKTGPITWQSNFTRDAYERAVLRIIDYIQAGDIYQANLSQCFSARLPEGFDPFAHYCTLRAVNPAPFAAYFNLGDGRIIASASPERFLQVVDGSVMTRPIKGTRRRNPDPATDRALAAELAASEKDRAENIMIVDLLRNDLSRVCTDGSIDVPSLCTVESFARVHHLVSTVTGRLHPGKTALDALTACFPGGSITGAPKIRAMEIIAELEKARRGPYCGAVGWLGANGDMDLNIAIRTLVYESGNVSFNVGGGITAASEPAAEYQETLDKAAAIFESFE